MKELQVYGEKQKEGSENRLPQGIYTEFEHIATVALSSTRSKSLQQKFKVAEDSVIVLHFQDGSEWIGHPDDVQEIYGNTDELRSGVSESFVFDANVGTSDTTRGVLQRILIKSMSMLRLKPAKDLVKITGKELAQGYDNRVQPTPGLYHIDKNFNLKPTAGNLETLEPYLLLVHGTLSTAKEAFGQLQTGGKAIWDELFELYGGQMLALEHKTLSVNPIQNAIDFLEQCATGIQIDIISHSRGGLVADILAMCDSRNTVIGFSAIQLGIVKEKDKVSHALMLEINALARLKRITVGKVVRIAAPSSGTTILSKRVDHFFNLMLNAVSLALGPASPLYTLAKSFLLELIKLKADPEVMAGLNSMVPDSLFQKALNTPGNVVVSDLYTISGDAEVGGFNLNSLKVLLANLFYGTANDLVVDTGRMLHGVPRLNGVFNFLSQDERTNHFNYFGNENTCQAIMQALNATEKEPAISYQKEIEAAGERGVVLDLFSLKGVHYSEAHVSGTRNIVILVPGIMGSTLTRNSDPQWVEMSEINKGGIAKNLSIKATNVSAEGVIEKYYDDFAKYLSKDYDVVTFPYDWRKPLKEAATKFKKVLESTCGHPGREVHIIAHSMGGLVTRQIMIDHPDTWDNFKSNSDNKFVMLGTPWLGSHLIMEVLTGHSSRVKQLAMIDFKNDREDLLKVFWKFPGVLQLLPIGEDTEFAQVKFWNALKKEAKIGRMPDASSNSDELGAFKEYRKQVRDFLGSLTQEDFENVYYVCGKAEQTVFGYRLKDRIFSKSKRLEYLATSHGDGSVTWETGIPKALNPSNLYYANTTHGDLSVEKQVFEGVSEILKFKKTAKLGTKPPLHRGGERISVVNEFAEPATNPTGVINALFGNEKATAPVAEEIAVTVVNGDLKIASYPVMVGHFYKDIIFGAEKALDSYLDHRLSQRRDIGYYPGGIGESEVFFNLNTNPHGAIVCGLGSTNRLTPFLLSKTVEMATLKYAMFMRDNYTLPKAKKFAKGISFILIGIGFGKLPIEASIRGILIGVTNANNYIKKTGEGLRLIKEVEFVNYYESITSLAYWSINRMTKSDHRLAIDLQPGVVKKIGAKKKQLLKDSQENWWHDFDISAIKEPFDTDNPSYRPKTIGFSYNSSGGYASVQREQVFISMDDINILLEQMASTSKRDKRLSKALFELMIPNEFKDILRNQNNVLIKLDKEAAQIPWEMFYDSAADETPVSVNSGFVRQLISDDHETLTMTAIGNNNALVIGDPLYKNDNLPQLPAAEEEGVRLANKLSVHKYAVDSLIHGTTAAIMEELFTGRYKILHFAGHGIYDFEKGKAGVAIGNGICIDAAKIKQLGYVPEFVFINCCFSGVINRDDDIYSRERYRLAANVGTQLIEMGVKAIVISGWAVDDGAAKTFSDTFYDKMLEGYRFGNAVQVARKACFDKHGNTNTWGAYQCYGSQYYQFKDSTKQRKKDYEYVVASQVYTDLDNLFVSIRYKRRTRERTQKKLNDIIEGAERAKLLDSNILEKEALIYDEMGLFDIALYKFEELFGSSDGDFSIKALERFCIIKSYKLEKDMLDADMEKIRNLILIGKNSSRLNIVGNAYKLASEHLSKKDKIDFLELAWGYYYDALVASADQHDGDCLDAFSNVVLIGHLLEKLGEHTLLHRLRKIPELEDLDDVVAYLNGKSKELEDCDETEQDISILIGMAEVDTCLLLLSDEKLDDVKEKVILRFKNIFRMFHSPKYLLMEEKQIDFLLSMNLGKTQKEALIEIQEALKKML
ncbi:CHAT domain-containing protein [Aggregatimonas sangjinii]|uniref:CHAT domain-containing protein n=1 Tax=Aggregatimonas sangjinii TaxID=2583587 RepID=A0A5B7SMV9_9FLAO|nr:CHAT domain-containing protein [Aggregatimonas sangjinii]QCW99895.1 CHAT domain-containing protein [Aggregatimonas sangjinii]